MNFEKINTFEGGLSNDLTNNVEKSNTYQKGFGGRIYQKDGIISFNAGKGSKLIYQNNQIVKYLGYYPFNDELIVFAKCLKPEGLENPGETQVCETILSTDSFIILSDVNSGDPINLDSEITDNSDAEEVCHTETVPLADESDFDIPYSCSQNNNSEIDFGQYFGTDITVPNFLSCEINKNAIPLNNQIYYDCIYSLTLDENNYLVGELLWVGTQNWPIEGKIVTEGIYENEYYKRVYYTDAYNVRRVMNRKDRRLLSRTENEFNQVLKNVLLQPEIKEITDGGQLNSMKSIYVYRIISENGQTSEFSPSSFFAVVIPKTEAIDFRGGDYSETTDKRVKIDINLLDVDPNSIVECIAIEFEADGPPTGIKNLGKKNANSVVSFEHIGNEPEFEDNITINDILAYTNIWKYCNAYTSKKNKLIAGGLRNKPIPSIITNLEYLFPLHSWNSSGETHNCLMNPRPWEFKYIDPSFEDDMLYVKEKIYRRISAFGPTTVQFKNSSTGDFFELTLDELNLNGYTDITQNIIDWLLDLQANNPNWTAYFPNLTISEYQNQLFLKPTIEAVQTDIANYVFISDNEQFIENFDNNLVFLNTVINTNNLIRGAQSIGFNQGNGIRVTYRQFKKPLLNQAVQVYDGTDKLLDYHAPDFERFFMKGEIYRLAFQTFDDDSTRFFSIPLGDIMIPSIGDIRTELDNSGNAIITSETIVNQSVENGILYGHGIKLHVEVRLSCQIQQQISMYQLVYVERDEENRTILCQGIAQPLNRVQYNGSPDHKMPDLVRNVWNLPYYGGPTYDKDGFRSYDEEGENFDYGGNATGEVYKRIISHRGLMYFDSPDLYFDKISSSKIANSKLDIIAKLKTDHTPEVIREHGGLFNTYHPATGEYIGTINLGNGNEVYPKFSRKILEDQIEGDNHSEWLPANASEDRETGSWESYFINVSVFAQYQNFYRQMEIKKAVEMKRGELISGGAFDIQHDVSNNTFGLSSQPWYYGSYQRDWKNQNGRPNSTIFRSAMTSPGYKTVIIKTEEDLFTDDFIGDSYSVNPQIRLGGEQKEVYDTTPLINIFKNNRETVYGGRSEQAYSSNTYIPLSRTIPITRSDNGTQYFDVEGDIFITLNIRVKNDFGDDEVTVRNYNNGGGGRAKGDIHAWSRNAAWTYAVVLESQVEPKLPYNYEFYRVMGTHSFQIERPEIINKAYMVENNIKPYVPKPYQYKDDPNLENAVAVSNVKVTGEPYDNWTLFKINNMYDLLEKNQGSISNLVRYKDEVFAIQSKQTSLLYIGNDRILSDAEGKPINVQQGSGTVVDGHKIISNYGTSIRRSVVATSNYGFSFFDERKVEFIKIDKPLLFENALHLDYFERHKKDKIVDTEIYFDEELKETNVIIKTKNSNNYCLSYNESFKKFNGEFPYTNDLFMMFDQKIYAPIRTGENENIRSLEVHQLNEGNVLNFFNQQYTMVLGFTVNEKIGKILQYASWLAVTNIDYPFEKIVFLSNMTQYNRIILGTHEWYKIRESEHTVPAINETNDMSSVSELRGNWIYVEMHVNSIDKSKINILAVINSLRYSHR